MLPDPILIAIAAAFGAALGSFLNVCIYRLPRDLSVVSPPSACPSCEHRLAWYDNLPVIGWILLRGRCRYCRTRVSVQYPLVELVVAVIWGAMVWRHGLTVEAARGAVFLTLLLGIAWTDVQHYIIPDEFTWGGLLLGLGFSVFGGWPSVLDAVIGAAVGFSILYAVAWLGEWLLKKEAMGGGDIKMLAMVGSFVGWKGSLLTIFGGALVGTIIFVPISMRTKKLVPFGVFLAVGAAVAFLAGDEIYRWYAEWVFGA